MTEDDLIGPDRERLNALMCESNLIFVNHLTPLPTGADALVVIGCLLGTALANTDNGKSFEDLIETAKSVVNIAFSIYKDIDQRQKETMN